MSKSFDNHIPIDYTEEQTEKRIKSFYTDPKKIRKGDPGHPEGCPVFLLHRVYTPAAEQEIAPGCRTGELGCVDCKMRLTRSLNERLAPVREKRVKLLRQPDYVWDVLQSGVDRARARAREVLEKVRAAMQMNYRG